MNLIKLVNDVIKILKNEPEESDIENCIRKLNFIIQKLKCQNTSS